ncbi:MAG: flagellar hook-associated protein FlgK [Roseateles sp.]|uniref:flagellar hook-associated protein FlgK n=1 Tax=Roseateles sp. TaxID=1971397 RepID=UPI0039EA7291
MSMIHNALSGAIAAQTVLNTTSQNLANAATPGYTRQGVLLSSRQALAGGLMAAGNGVQVSSLVRFADGYKSQQMWKAASELGRYDAGQPYLDQLESVMSDDTSNINNALDGFFASLNAASVQPDSASLRSQVLTAADTLAKRIAGQRQLFTTQLNALGDQRGAAVSQINGYTADVALLNRQIAAAQAGGLNTSGLLDARDQRIDALAALAGVQVVAQADGTVNVSLNNGQPLVVGDDAAVLSQNGGALELRFANTTFGVASQGLGGQLGGVIDYELQVLKPMQQTVTELAAGIAQKFNGQLALAGGPALFTPDGLGVTGITAAQLAFAGPGEGVGGGANLTALIKLKDSSLAVTQFGGTGTVLGDIYTQLVGTLGVRSQQNQAAQTTAQTVRDQSQATWAATSGVNTDEEAINLMQYQQMYQANMKVIAAAGKLFDSTLAAF